MKALEVWIKGEKKCVAGTDDQVLNAFLDVVGHPASSRVGLFRVRGLIDKGDDAFHVSWLNEQLQVGDEVRILLLETEVVDPPISEERKKTQAEKDDAVRKGLLDVRAMLPGELGQSDMAEVKMFEQRMEEENWGVAMRVLSELGRRNVVASSYWKELEKVASQLQRYDEASQHRKREAETRAEEKGLVPEVRDDDVKAQHMAQGEVETKSPMRAIEVWINGEKKCVVGNEGRIFSAILSMTGDPRISVGGIVKKEGESFHADWLNEQLRIGDEIRIRLIETEEVDPPQKEKRSQTQTERDNEIKGCLMEARNKLPSEVADEESALQLFEQRMEEENWVAAMKVLGELGQRHSPSSFYWKELCWVAFLLHRYDEAEQYRSKRIEAEKEEQGS